MVWWRRLATAVSGFADFLLTAGACLSGILDAMEQREEHGAVSTATDEERAEARTRFRRKLAEAEERMTPEKRAEVRAAFGLDQSAA